MQLFRTLDPDEEAEFRAWARTNYDPLSPINGVWHPVIQDECRKINAEAGGFAPPKRRHRPWPQPSSF
jgi:hypothetical protein